MITKLSRRVSDRGFLLHTFAKHVMCQIEKRRKRENTGIIHYKYSLGKARQ